MSTFEGFEILEQAALEMIGAADESEFLRNYRIMLNRVLKERLGDEISASRLADEFVNIIMLRRKEIEMASGIHSKARQ